MITNTESPAYKLVVELADISRTEGKPAAQARWSRFVAERQTEGSPVKYWEMLAIADTVQGLLKT